jgi:hypothetical protein
MSSMDPNPAAPSNVPHAAVPRKPAPVTWIRELPFAIVLLLTLGGVAYTTLSKNPIAVYWEILAPIIALVCVGYGWPSARGNAARLRLIATQALHWAAFLLAMNMVLLSSVQRIFNASVTGLGLFALLALGTFTAGVHVLSWQVCLLGLIMAAAIPAIAWIENAALVVVLIAGVVLGIVAVVWRHYRDRRAATG